MVIRDAFTFMRSFFYLTDNNKKNQKGKCRFNPLFKVKFTLDTIQKALLFAWVAGLCVIINPCMIKYICRKVSYREYMPAKPLRHGIKCCCLCCAHSSVMCVFNI